MAKKIRRSPSLMCAHLGKLEEDVRILDTLGFADEYHVDIIDWHYCKNMSLAPCFIEALRPITNRPIEAHLYVDNVDTDLIELCMASGTDIITVQADVVGRQIHRLADVIARGNRKLGVCLNPSMPLQTIEEYADVIDRLLILTVDPGYPGQAFVESTLTKIDAARDLRNRRGLHFDIEVDGCCNEHYYRALSNAGAETFVLGSSGLFNKDTDLTVAANIAQDLLDRELLQSEREEIDV